MINIARKLMLLVTILTGATLLPSGNATAKDSFKISFKYLQNLLNKIIIVELDKFPKWKYLMCLITDKLLYPLDKTNYRSSENLQDLLKKYNFEVEAIPMHFRSIYSHITYIAKKI